MQTDFNGEFETFAPVSVSCSSDLNDVITLYPNPAATMLNVAMNVESEDTGAINIYNELGQLVKFLKVQSYAGSNNFTMDVSELPNGQYYVCFAMQNKRYPVQKLVVIR
jgi:flagellar hook assembly protein FlgD